MGTSRHSLIWVVYTIAIGMFCFDRTSDDPGGDGAGSVESGKPCVTKDVDDALLQVPIWAPCWDIQN